MSRHTVREIRAMALVAKTLFNDPDYVMRNALAHMLNAIADERETIHKMHRIRHVW